MKLRIYTLNHIINWESIFKGRSRTCLERSKRR